MLLLLTLTPYLEVLYALWPNPAVCSLSPSYLMVSVSALGLSEHVGKQSQGAMEDIPHAERNSTCFWFELSMCWVDFSRCGRERSPYPQVLDCTCAQVLS